MERERKPGEEIEQTPSADAEASVLTQEQIQERLSSPEAVQRATEREERYAEHIREIHREIESMTDEDFEEMLRHIEAGEPMEFRELGAHEDKLLLYRLRKAAKERLEAVEGFRTAITKTHETDPEQEATTLIDRAKGFFRRKTDTRFTRDMERYRAMRRKAMNVVERANLLQFKLREPQTYAQFHDIDATMHELEHEIREATGVEARDILKEALEPKERKIIDSARSKDPLFDERLQHYADARSVMVAMLESSGIDLETLPDANDNLVDDSAIPR